MKTGIIATDQVNARTTLTVTLIRLGGQEELTLFKRVAYPGIEKLNPADQQVEQKGWSVRWDEGELTDEDIELEAHELIFNYKYENGLFE